jgi:hypothetical protein
MKFEIISTYDEGDNIDIYKPILELLENIKEGEPAKYSLKSIETYMNNLNATYSVIAYLEENNKKNIWWS